MILVDANILIYAVNEDAPLNPKARAWLQSTISGPGTLGLSWSVLLAFLRLTTRTGLFRRPLPVEVVLDLISSWLEQPSVTVVHPGPQHLRILRELLMASGAGGNLTSDAHLAALAIEHGAELSSSDSDFALPRPEVEQSASVALEPRCYQDSKVASWTATPLAVSSPSNCATA